jgi:hypothetical protein
MDDVPAIYAGFTTVFLKIYGTQKTKYPHQLLSNTNIENVLLKTLSAEAPFFYSTALV